MCTTISVTVYLFSDYTLSTEIWVMYFFNTHKNLIQNMNIFWRIFYLHVVKVCLKQKWDSFKKKNSIIFDIFKDLFKYKMMISCSEFIQYQRLMPYKKMIYIFLFYKALFLSMMEIFPVILSLFQVTCGFNRGVDVLF